MTTLAFNGPSYVPARDDQRLTAQFNRVMNVMADHEWHTLRGINTVTHDPEASISAQLRHARKDRFGGYIIERRYVGSGLHEYRWVL